MRQYWYVDCPIANGLHNYFGYYAEHPSQCNMCKGSNHKAYRINKDTVLDLTYLDRTEQRVYEKDMLGPDQFPFHPLAEW